MKRNKNLSILLAFCSLICVSPLAAAKKVHTIYDFSESSEKDVDLDKGYVKFKDDKRKDFVKSALSKTKYGFFNQKLQNVRNEIIKKNRLKSFDNNQVNEESIKSLEIEEKELIKSIEVILDRVKEEALQEYPNGSIGDYVQDINDSLKKRKKENAVLKKEKYINQKNLENAKKEKISTVVDIEKIRKERREMNNHFNEELNLFSDLEKREDDMKIKEEDEINRMEQETNRLLQARENRRIRIGNEEEQGDSSWFDSSKIAKLTGGCAVFAVLCYSCCKDKICNGSKVNPPKKN